ncbi:MAG: hypothetical protein Q8M92_11080, partial [Candidatus Subteraquimicrobiales bacterium]|nr:hypothetical protein [Candidatus Subteraquimicrobiales bacterium]
MFFVFNEEESISRQEISESSPKLLEKKFSFIGLVLMVAIIGGLIGSLILPLFFGVNPLDFYGGKYLPASEETTSLIGPAPYITEPVIVVAKRVQPSVVNIRTERVVSDFFFGLQRTTGIGSGVIISEDGYILT